jgi:hypothetical protein
MFLIELIVVQQQFGIHDFGRTKDSGTGKNRRKIDCFEYQVYCVQYFRMSIFFLY